MPASDRASAPIQFLASCAVFAVLCSAPLAQTPPPGGGHQPNDPPTAAAHAAFIAVTAALKPPTPTQVRPSYGELCAQYAAGFQAASAALATFHLQLGQIAATPGADPILAGALADAVDSIRIGFAGAGNDFLDGSISSQLSYWLAADGFSQLAALLPAVHPDFVDTALPADAAASSLTGILNALTGPTGDPFDVVFTNLFALHAAHVALVEALVPDLAPPAGQPAASGCGPGMYRGCTNYEVTNYSGVTCGEWSRLVGGITIGVGCSGGGEGGVGGCVEIGTTICPDGGLFVRTCTMQACLSRTCVCECYGSRWDRFWAIDGSSKTTTVTDLGCSPETFTEYEWECAGPPSAAPPAAPGRDISMGDSMNC